MPRVLVKEIKNKKNYIINGDFDLWQRTNALQTYGAQITYHADRFAWAAGTITGAVQSEKIAVTSYSNSTIIPRSCVSMQRYNVSTAQPSLGANATAGPWYKMEGYDFNEVLEQGGLSTGVTLSFYVASSVTGTYTVEFTNSGTNNRYFKTYSITGSNTWQRVSITLTAAEIATGIGSGTWNYTNGVGLLMRFWLAAGTASQGVAQNLWTGATANVPAAQVNFLSTLNNTWGITGLMMTVGNVTSDFKIRGESFAEELMLAQRFFEKSYDLETNLASLTNAGILINTGVSSAGLRIPGRYAVVKRATPIVTIYNPGTGTVGQARSESNTNGAVSINTNGTSGFTITDANTLALNIWSIHFGADAEL